MEEWDFFSPSLGVLVASGPVGADGSVLQIAAGTGTAAFPELFVSGVDKCGSEGARVRVENGAALSSTPIRIFPFVWREYM